MRKYVLKPSLSHYILNFYFCNLNITVPFSWPSIQLRESFVPERTSRFLYLSFFFFSFPLSAALSSLWIPSCNERQVQRTQDDVTSPCREFIIWVRCPTTLAFFFRVRTAIWARSWLSFFPISLARRHHAVTDDVPSCRRFFRDERLSRVTLVSPRPSECMLYASVLSLRVRYHYLCVWGEWWKISWALYITF